MRISHVHLHIYMHTNTHAHTNGFAEACSHGFDTQTVMTYMPSGSSLSHITHFHTFNCPHTHMQFCSLNFLHSSVSWSVFFLHTHTYYTHTPPMSLLSLSVRSSLCHLAPSYLSTLLSLSLSDTHINTLMKSLSHSHSLVFSLSVSVYLNICRLSQCLLMTLLLQAS